MQLLGWICTSPGRIFNPTALYIIIFNVQIAQATHIPTLHASHPTCALKGQNPSAVGTALGNAAHNKTRPNGAKAFC